MRLLDAYCGAGGAGMGYHQAGFEVVGVDIKFQKRYPFEFHQGDAIEFIRDHGHEFDVIHASPPCQRYSVANNIHGRTDHPDLIPGTREVLLESGKPYVIENVPRSPLINPVVLCGLSLGCNVKRHRLFESNLSLVGTVCGKHKGDWLLVFGHTVLERGHVTGIAKGGGPVIRRKHTTTERGREAMGIPWMSRDELSEAIPPAYTKWIGDQLMIELQRRKCVAVQKYERGTRGLDQNGSVVYVSRVVEVKDVQGTIYRYWVVDGDGDKPGTGPLRLLELGGFVATSEPPTKHKPDPEYHKVMIRECEAVTLKGYQT